MYKKIPTVSSRVPPMLMTVATSLAVMCLIGMATYAARAGL